jgi:hypothetical protein
VFVYSVVMLLIFLFSGLAVICIRTFNDNMDNVKTFSAMMKSAAHVISHSCFLFSAVLFFGEFVNFLHVLLSFNSSIYFSFISFDSNFSYVKAQMSVLVPLHTLSAFLICLGFAIKNYPHFCLCSIMAVSVLSINVVTVLFIH